MTEPAPAKFAEAVLKAARRAVAARVLRLDHGMSGDLVLRLETDGETLFAKLGDPARRISVSELARETAALGWLGGRIDAPTVIWSGHALGRPALLMTATAGTPLHELAPEQSEAGAIAALAALTELHALPLADCPFHETLDVKLAEARRRIDGGEVEVTQLEAEHAGQSLEGLWRELLARRPATEDLVVTHGDACWPNFILRPDGRAGVIDLGRFGVADRHQDLALFIRSATHNFPTLAIEAIVDAHYPLAPVDPEKLVFYRLLDEFY